MDVKQLKRGADGRLSECEDERSGPPVSNGRAMVGLKVDSLFLVSEF